MRFAYIILPPKQFGVFQVNRDIDEEQYVFANTCMHNLISIAWRKKKNSAKPSSIWAIMEAFKRKAKITVYRFPKFKRTQKKHTQKGAHYVVQIGKIHSRRTHVVDKSLNLTLFSVSHTNSIENLRHSSVHKHRVNGFTFFLCLYQ